MSTFEATLANEYAYATEISLATLSSLLFKKSTAKSEILRQTSICLRQLGICQAFKSDIEWGDGRKHHFGRVEDLVKNLNIRTALDGWIAEHKH